MTYSKATTLALLACILLTACGQPACDPHPGYRPDGQRGGGPHCDTLAAHKSYIRYKAAGKRAVRA